MNEDDSVSPRDWRDRPAKSPEEAMQNEIKPMSAEDILEEFDNIFPEKHWLRNALAAYTKFLLEKMPKIEEPIRDKAFLCSVCGDHNECQCWGEKVGSDNCRSILQDQIDQLTK